MNRASLKNWLWRLGRVAVSAGVLAVIVARVQWRTTAELPDGRQVRVLERTDAGVWVRQGQGRQFYRNDQLAQVGRPGGATGPKITIGLLDPEMVRRIRWGPLAAAVLVFAGAPFFQAFRWRRLLHVQNVRLTAATALKLMWIGLFFNTFLLGAVGGDLVKAYYVTKHASARAESAVTVLVDRVIGLLGLLWLSAAAIAVWLATGARSIPGGLPWAWMTPGVAVLVGGAVFYNRWLRRLLGVERFLARLGETHILSRLDRAVYLYRRHKLLVLEAFAWTFVSHVCLLGSVYFASQALQVGASLMHVVVFGPIVFVGSGLIPSVGGLGVQEYGFILFFAQLGIGDVAQSLALGLLVRLSSIVCSLPGAVLLSIGAGLPSRAEMERQVQGGSGVPPL